jgi:hypothetical protein
LNFCIEQIIGRLTATGEEEEEEVKTWLTGGKKVEEDCFGIVCGFFVWRER